MRRFIAFNILILVKIFSMVFYRAKYHWLDKIPQRPWKDIRLMILLNHTSLFEPLFIQILPIWYLWHLSGHFSLPGADITLNRLFVGRFWKLMIPNISPITRKKDASWDNYLCSIRPNDVVIIAPEGRMKRPGGRDKFGKSMTVRAGVADIIQNLNNGHILICLSGGLHHVQAPGQHFPRLFKKIQKSLLVCSS